MIKGYAQAYENMFNSLVIKEAHIKTTVRFFCIGIFSK